VKFLIARHFGFCYGVENAIEISYKAIVENEGKRIYLLSEMIHNPDVNNDLRNRGVKFLMDTRGNKLIDIEELKPDDIVIIPAFGTTLELEQQLMAKNIEIKTYNTTCPFVERVWKRSEKLGEQDYAIVIHGKHYHEETRATFSRSSQKAPCVIVKDIEETKVLAQIIKGELPEAYFYEYFKGKHSLNFNPKLHLSRLGVVNQTTMLARDTQEIANYLKTVLIEKFGEEGYKDHFADTRDTLCYATNDNQSATYGLLEKEADLAIVVGGYNSSNTAHLVELCEKKLPTYFICNADKLYNKSTIVHFDIHEKLETITESYIPDIETPTIILTCGASCPDSIIEQVMLKLVSFFEGAKTVEELDF